MADNSIPYAYEPLVEFLEDARDGVANHGAGVPVKQNDAPSLTLVLESLKGKPAGPGNVPPAVPGLKDKWNAAKAAKTDATAALRLAKSNGRTLAMTSVGVLKPRMGTKWNSAWNAAGFTNGSLEIPDNPMVVLQQLSGYFGLNPTHEVPDVTPTISCTAAACHAAAEAISDADVDSNESNSNAGTAKAALEAGIRAARKRLTSLREELATHLSPEDERWYLFGFDRPADPNTPEMPENLTFVLGVPGTKMIFLDWDNARRADSYRVIISAGSGDPVFEEIYTESEATVTLTALGAGASVNVSVTARNDAGGESQPSEPITVTVP